MPHDKNGSPLAQGDKVSLTGSIHMIHSEGVGCNVTIAVDNGSGEEHVPMFTMNSRGVEKCINGTEPVAFGSGPADLGVETIGHAFAGLAAMPGSVQAKGLISDILGVSSSLSTIIQIAKIISDNWNDVIALIAKLQDLLAQLRAVIKPTPSA